MTRTATPPGSAAGRDPAVEVAARLPVTDLRAWVLLLGIAGLIAGGLVWAVLGRAPELVTGRGMVVPATGFVDVGTEAVGSVLEVSVAPGDLVEAGQQIARLAVPDAGRQSVTTPVSGRVATVLARRGGITEPGVPMATIDPTGVEQAVVAFLPAGPAKRVVPGMAVLVAPDAAPRSEYGMATGTVAAVAPLPATAARVEVLVGGDEALAGYYLQQGPVLEVTVALDSEPANPTGWSWTLGSGPEAPLSAGTLADVSVVLADRAPISRILQ